MKKIFIVDEHQSSKQNGVGTYIRQLLLCFEESSYEINLLSFNSDEKEFKITHENKYKEYHIPICGQNIFLYNGALSLSLLRIYIDDSRENVFFVNHSPCNDFLKILKHVFRNSRIIFVIHDQGWCAPLLGDHKKLEYILSRKTKLKNEKQLSKYIKQYVLNEKKMYQIADDIVVLGQTTNRLLKDIYHIPETKIHLIPNGKQITNECYIKENKEKIRKRFGINESDFIFLYAGRTVESKGIMDLLMAFEELYKIESKARLIIAGQVFKLNDFSKLTPNSCSRITYTGLINYEMLSDWYSVADVGILPSYTEQSSFLGIELLSQGCLIIASDGHNMDDMFNSEVALIAHINRYSTTFKDELCRLMQTAIHMPLSQRHLLKRNARERAEQHYSINIMRERYLELLK